MTPLLDSLVAHLVILVGRNPLPNYVSALALGTPGKTAITLVHTNGTMRQRMVLEELLRQHGFIELHSQRVEEANPSHIYNQLRSLRLPSAHLVMLDYTGGTKAMAVHACRALRDRAAPPITEHGLLELRCCYLDARTLALQIEDSRGAAVTALPLGTAVPVRLETMFTLHGLGQLKREMHHEPVWPKVAAALALLHQDPSDADEWRNFCERHLRDPQRRRLLRLSQLRDVSTDSFPLAARQVAELLAAGAPLPQLIAPIAAHAGFARGSDELSRWLDGSWLEHHVLAHVQTMRHTAHIHDAAVTINPLLPEPAAGRRADFEFDVCFVRGHQLFALSCTTSDRRDRCKSKLLEAVVRAQQLGGAEARIGLVCCYDQPEELRAEVQELLGSRVQVFGRYDLIHLNDRLQAWMNTSSLVAVAA